MFLCAHRLAFPGLNIDKGCLSVYKSRAYDWTSLTVHRSHTYDSKFSVHLTVRHQTHMFACLDNMHSVLALFEAHRGWTDIKSIVDMSVYGAKQLFRVPCATKAPHFDKASNLFELHKQQNVLLPVNPVTGVQEYPFVTRGHLFLPFQQWSQHLVTTFREGERAKPFKSAMFYSDSYISAAIQRY